MDTITLVEEQIDDGQRLIDRLSQQNIPVEMACWVKPVDEDRWSLYIAASLVDEKGAAGAYREVYRVLRSLQNCWVTDSDVKLIGLSDQITKDVLDIRKRFPGRSPTRSRRPRLGNLAVEETYVYPLAGQDDRWPRLSLTISYVRNGETNQWRARTKVEEICRGINVKGAVGYSTALWEGEKQEDVKHASVAVLLEVDPKNEDSITRGDTQLLRILIKQANTMADEMFKRHHPDAVVVHADERSDQAV